MGVKNLLKFVSPICKPTNIHDFRGRKIGIDMSCFLYKALYHTNFLKHINIYLGPILKIFSRVYLVFDGRPPISKHSELQNRAKNMVTREITSRITPELTRKVILAYKTNPKISVVFSPEESDSQLAYLSITKIVDVILTEDSDLIVYGCPLILFKYKPRGSCVIFKKEFLENFIPWDFKTFKWICILSGCDYLRGGLKGLSL